VAVGGQIHLAFDFGCYHRYSLLAEEAVATDYPPSRMLTRMAKCSDATEGQREHIWTASQPGVLRHQGEIRREIKNGGELETQSPHYCPQ
jgi:hypothetical protein